MITVQEHPELHIGDPLQLHFPLLDCMDGMESLPINLKDTAIMGKCNCRQWGNIIVADHLSPQEVIKAYHTLWTIEESFRIMKSTLEVRPIFHWTPRRIRGHFVVCFLAFLLERTLERSLKGAGIPASPETIREALNSLQVAKIEINHEPYFLKMKETPLSHQILRLFKIPPPKNITPLSEFKLKV